MSKNIKNITKELVFFTAGDKATVAEIQLSCLLRIADATEQMAQPFAQMVQELERYKKWYAEVQAENKQLKLSIIAHKAAYTRLKNKQELQNKEIIDDTER